MTTSKAVNSEDDFFFIDTLATKPETEKRRPANTEKPKLPTCNQEMVKKMMEKATLSDDFDQRPSSEVCVKSARAKRRERKAVRESTAGNGWFNMPATEITEENRRDLELLQMRKTLDPKAQYRRNDLSVLPKYFQKGKIVDSSADFYSSRIPQRQRKQTMVEELMQNYEFLATSKRRYSEAKAREAQMRKRRVNPMKKFKKKKAG